jgi:D-mannonate dehydratase
VPVQSVVSFFLSRYNVANIARRAELKVSRLRGILEGRYKGYSWENSRLSQLYNDIQKRRMRLAGVPLREANKYRTYSPQYVDRLIGNVKSIVERIAKSVNADTADIRRGISMSDKTIDTIEKNSFWY